MSGGSAGRGGEAGTLRRLLLLLLLLGIVGLAAELALLGHTESLQQWVPLAALGAALVSTLAVALRPSPGTLRVFQAVMAACVAAGAVGLWLHLRGNLEWELESDPAAGGLRLLWDALAGATPTLAPGALAQLGLLGLALTYRHPALRRSPSLPERP